MHLSRTRRDKLQNQSNFKSKRTDWLRWSSTNGVRRRESSKRSKSKSKRCEFALSKIVIARLKPSVKNKKRSDC